MAIQKTEAIILKKMDFRDTSLIVTFFSRDFGKMKAVVKGVRKEGSADLADFEILNHVHLVFYEKSRSDLHLVSETCVENSMLNLRNSFRGLAYASFLAELIDSLYEVHEVSAGIFDSFLNLLKNLNSQDLYQQVLQFELRVLKDAGIFPSLKNCARCAVTHSEQFFWSSKQGGLLCRNCAPRESKTIELTPELVACIRELDKMDFDCAMKDSFNGSLFEKIEKLIRNFIGMRVEFPLRSAEFLSRTETWARKSKQEKDISPLISR